MTAVRVSVVIVEDNPLHLQRYRENLALDSSLVLLGEFGTARDAMAAVAGLAPDVALVDLGLPDGSGFDVIRHIRHASPQTAVMVVWWSRCSGASATCWRPSRPAPPVTC